MRREGEGEVIRHFAVHFSWAVEWSVDVSNTILHPIFDKVMIGDDTKHSWTIQYLYYFVLGVEMYDIVL